VAIPLRLERMDVRVRWGSFSDADLARLLLGLAVLLVAAHGVGGVFARFSQPAAIGEIAGGALLGSSLFTAVFPTAQHWLFPSSGSSAAALGAVYQLGLLLLMFAAGTQMRRLMQRDASRRRSLWFPCSVLVGWSGQPATGRR
jgi:Kef-type K+ transport system membrane component KefB